MGNSGQEETVLEARGLTLSFGAVAALRRGDLTLIRGSVTALVGDNGAGKSTLIQCLTGALVPDSGKIFIRGRSFDKLTVRQSRSLGIAAVYQDLALADNLDVAANIWLGAEPLKWGIVINRRKMICDAEKLLERLSIRISATALAGTLSGGQRQAAAVARAVAQGGKILILDEPTAAMGIREGTRILELLRTLKSQGTAILCISHNLSQVLQIADSVVVLRQGVTVRQMSAAGLDAAELAQWMSGVKS